MKRPIPISCAWICVLAFWGCKKDTAEIRTATINGSVLNLCTNKNMAGINVSLVTHGPEGASSRTYQSDANGNFTFSNVSINMSSDYHYNVYIQSKSGIGSGPEVGFAGVDVSVDKKNLSHYFVLGVVPHFKLWSFYFPAGTNLSTGDTITLTMQQNIFHANVPQNGNYKITLINSPQYPIPASSGNYIGTSGNGWMGWWHSTLEKVKNGVYTIKTDSFYIDWGQTKADTIPF